MSGWISWSGIFSPDLICDLILTFTFSKFRLNLHLTHWCISCNLLNLTLCICSGSYPSKYCRCSFESIMFLNLNYWYDMNKRKQLLKVTWQDTVEGRCIWWILEITWGCTGALLSGASSLRNNPRLRTDIGCRDILTWTSWIFKYAQSRYWLLINVYGPKMTNCSIN